MKISRRSFLETAAALGASLAWVVPARGSSVDWQERRDLYPEGVASGDPDPHSVILWTRRPFAQGPRQILTVDGYRAIYKGHLDDPDLQDARARWPFVAMWDNHEFSWQGWQSFVKAGSFEQPGQSIKVAVNQG